MNDRHEAWSQPWADEELNIVISDSGEPGQVYATLEEYDGTPDATGPNTFVGVGPTEYEAEEDLKRQLSEYAESEAADYGDYLYEQRKDKQHETG